MLDIFFLLLSFVHIEILNRSINTFFPAYTSWIRFYSSYPRDMRQIFNRRDLHLGHYAKSFALRETPQRIGGIGRRLHEKECTRKRQLNDNRLTGSGK